MKILFVGDIALRDHPKAVGSGFFSRYARGVPAARTRDLFPGDTKADIIAGNLEFCLGSDTIGGSSIEERMCRGLSRYASFLAQAGFSVLNVANNHISQHGQDLYYRTLEDLERVGIKLTGVPHDFADDSAITVSGERVCFLGWSDRPRQYGGEKPPYNEFSEETSLREIERARCRADVVCVSLHWGKEFIQVPTQRERRLARAMIDSGATVVFGHHPHVLRAIEEHRGGLIAYSLGNFIGDMTWDRSTRETGCLVVEIVRGKVSGYSLRPAMIGQDYLPEYLPTSDVRPFLERLDMVFREQQEEVDSQGYDLVAETKRRRHQRKLLWSFIRRSYTIHPKFLFQMASTALKNRLG